MRIALLANVDLYKLLRNSVLRPYYDEHQSKFSVYINFSFMAG